MGSKKRKPDSTHPLRNPTSKRLLNSQEKARSETELKVIAFIRLACARICPLALIKMLRCPFSQSCQHRRRKSGDAFLTRRVSIANPSRGGQQLISCCENTRRHFRKQSVKRDNQQFLLSPLFPKTVQSRCQARIFCPPSFLVCNYCSACCDEHHGKRLAERAIIPVHARRRVLYWYSKKAVLIL